MGNPLPVPPLIQQIAKHPILRQRKLIAEPWDLGMYQVGGLLADRLAGWAEWADWVGGWMG